MKRSRVVAWLPADPWVRVMARATAEAAVRGVELYLLSPAPPPPQWSSWRSAAASLGVRASWHTVPHGTHEGMPDALSSEAARAALVVTDTTSFGAATRSQLAQLVDVYVVADTRARSQARTREPAVLVGVPDSADSARLVSAAGREADLRNRNLIVLHAQPRAIEVRGQEMVRRWLAALPCDPTGASRAASRVVVTHRPVTDALRDHVDVDDVLVVGVRPPGDEDAHSLDASLLAAPPCDLLLTATAGVQAEDVDTANAAHRLDLAV